jgi:hypothetical protein
MHIFFNLKKNIEMKSFFIHFTLFCCTFFSLNGQIDYGENKSHKHEVGLHVAPYLFLEKGVNVFFKSDIKPAESWSGRKTERRVWISLGQYNRKFKDKLLSNTSEYYDFIYARTRNWSFVNFGIERVFRKEKSEMWFGSHLGFLYRVTNNIEKEKLKLAPLYFHSYTYYTENQDYGVPVGLNFGYSRLLSKQFYVGTELNASLEIIKRFERVDKEVPELVTSEKDDFLVAFGKGTFMRLLFLTYKF